MVAPKGNGPAFKTLQTAYFGLKGFGQTANVGIGVGEKVNVGVTVGVLVGIGVLVMVAVGLLVGVLVGVFVFIGVFVGVFEGVLVDVFVGVLVGVKVGVLVAIGVGLFVGVLVGVAVLQRFTLRVTKLEVAGEFVTLLAVMVNWLLTGAAIQPTVPHQVTGHSSITEPGLLQTRGPLGTPEVGATLEPE